MAFWNRKNVTPPTQPSTSAPINGNIKPENPIKPTTLKAKEIGIAVAVGILVIAAIFYFVITGIGLNFGSGSKSVGPASAKAPPISPPSSSGPADLAPPTGTSKPSGGNKSKHVPPDNPNVPPAAPATTAKSPQFKAFTSALKGGSTVVSWSKPKNEQKTANAPASNNEATKQKPLPSVYGHHLVRKEVSPYELLQGTVIPAVLETGIKSDIAGEITAIVSHPVYNSVSGAYVLIPAGSKLVGTYSNKIVAGDTRVAVAWTRIEFPNGTYLNLGKGMPGASASGYSGFHDLVDNHTWAIFRSALLLSVIDIGMAVSSPQQTTSANGVVSGNVALADGEQGLAQTFGEAEAQLLQREINIAPTLTIPTGYPFNVVVTKDMVFPGAYQHGLYVKNEPVLPVAMPSTFDAYKGA